MNKRCFALAMVGLIEVDAAAADPPATRQILPWLAYRADAALLFDPAERQSALASVPSLPLPLPPQLDQPGPLLASRGQRYLSSAEFEQKIGRGTGILRLGLLREAGGAPGMQSMSMLLNTGPTTRFTSLSLGYALSSRDALVAMASYGKTAGIGSPDSLLAQMSAVRTLAYGAGYVRRQLFADNDRLAVTWSMPARVRSEAAAPNLRSTATERDLEFSYTRVLGRDGSNGRLSGALMWRVNPRNDANARPEVLMGVRYAYGF